MLTHLETDEYSVRHLSFPSVGVNGQAGNLVDVWYFQSRLPDRKKLVIVLPIWGSYKYPSWQITQGILRRSKGDTNVALTLGENHLFDWEGLGAAQNETAFVRLMQDMVGRVRTTVIDIRRLIDWAETQPDIDPQRIGLVGFSMGALVAGSTLVDEPRLAAGVLVMGGAHPHEILAICSGRPQEVRENVLPRFGWTVERYREILAPIFAPVNPASYPRRADPRRVLIFDAYHDDCIPQRARDALWDAMGRPERIGFLYTHKVAFLSMTPLGMYYLRGKIYEFLDRAL